MNTKKTEKKENVELKKQKLLKKVVILKKKNQKKYLKWNSLCFINFQQHNNFNC